MNREFKMLKGYRRLRDGQTIQEGDLYWSVRNGWIDTVMCGKRVGQALNGGILSNTYIRKARVNRKS